MTVLNLTALRENRKSFTQRVNAASGTDVDVCYQCGKCSGGCPVSRFMDRQPNQIIRMVQLGLKDAVLQTKTIWLCAHCNTCTVRCPRQVDIAGVMETLRHMARNDGYQVPVPAVAALDEAFLNSVQENGRVFELGMMAGYKFKTGEFFKDLALGNAMFARGKLGLRPHKIKGTDEIARIFKQVKEAEGGH